MEFRDLTKLGRPKMPESTLRIKTMKLSQGLWIFQMKLSIWRCIDLRNRDRETWGTLIIEQLWKKGITAAILPSQGS